MTNLTNASNEDASIKSSHLEQRTTVLYALARIIAKAYLGKAAADKNGSIEITLPDSQSHSVKDISRGDM
jgi:hypothetical protein